MTNAPPELQIKEKFGIRNAYKDCIDNDEVYILSNDDKNVNAIADYIKRNYNEKATVVLVRKFKNSSYCAYQRRTDVE